ncbi:NAD-dependent epimerase/dehydratase family protein [Pasteurellaceae bacterium 22721_9_1]
MNALIGYTGFVGNTILKQKKFECLFNSKNIAEIDNQEFELVVCSAAPAQKWLANKEPDNDLKIINGLIEHLKTIKCNTFILISTVDVFKDPIDVDEDTAINEENLQPYGLHRRYLEKFVESHFENYLIVRLPGLVGPGLKKNIIFDFLNNNNLNMIDSRGIFQFYPMVNLWSDIQVALENKLHLIHLTSEPISVEEVAKNGFGFKFEQSLINPPAKYDMQSKFAVLYGAEKYQYSKKETLLAIRAYAQSENTR